MQAPNLTPSFTKTVGLTRWTWKVHDAMAPGFIEPHAHPDILPLANKLDVDLSSLLTDSPPDKDGA